MSSRTKVNTGSEKSLEEELRNLLSQKITQLPTVKDLPRLACRMVVEVCGSEFGTSTSSASPSIGRHGSPKVPPCDLPESAPPVRHLDELRRVVVAVARQLDGESAATKVESFLAAQAERDDLEVVSRKLLLDVLGGDASASARLFKATNQTMISSGMWRIKTKLPVSTTTKDVRGPEGWRITIRFLGNSVTVTHVRREEGTCPTQCGESWWFEWSLSMVFDKKVDSLQSCRVRVLSLHFDEGFNPDLRQQIDRGLCHGALIM